MKGLLAASLGVALVAGAILARPAVAQDDLPDGPGKAILMTSCNTGCHSVSQVTGEHQTADQWNSTITNMMNFGATIPDDQIGTLVAYLATNFGVQDQPAPGSAVPPASGAAPIPPANTPAPAQTPAAQ